MTSGSQLLTLLHLCDSLFPVGGFTHSDGLEAASASGSVRSVGDLRLWMEACLTESLARFEGPAVLLALQYWNASDWARLIALDAEVYAMRPSSSGRRATRSMGSRLIRTWQRIHPDGELRNLPDACRDSTWPVAFGIACAGAGVGVRVSLEGFIYVRLAATTSAAMRLIAIGQHEAHSVLAETLGRVPAVVQGILDREERPMAFAPACDIAAMSHQYVHSRLFRS